ncbi:hypothetical protein [Methylobacter svalbardensis]|uniref:hypothetical protein n=1 Tax=Methylobacter svalbardensis TaxID=3080016 RepID=UPI0030EE4313
MTTPSITTKLAPAIDVLAKCLTQTSENYQQLLNQPDSYDSCLEAGRSMRRLSKHYTEVVLAALPYQSVLDEDTEEWEDDNELPFEEDPD